MTLTRTRNTVDLQVRVLRDMRKVFESDATWETKYDLIFSLAKELRDLGVTPEYYDPDTTYEEDATACFRAFEEAVLDRAKALGISEVA